MAIGSPTLGQNAPRIPAMAEVSHEEANFMRPRLDGMGSEESGTVSVPHLYFQGFHAVDRPVLEDESVLKDDGVGAIRGFVFVLGLYAVMGALGLGGFMIFDWLR